MIYVWGCFNAQGSTISSGNLRRNKQSRTRAASRFAVEKRTLDEDYLERDRKKRAKEVPRGKRKTSAKSSWMGDGCVGWNSRSLHYFAAFWRTCISAITSIDNFAKFVKERSYTDIFDLQLQHFYWFFFFLFKSYRDVWIF